MTETAPSDDADLETRIPGDIQSVNDLRYHVRKCFDALLDPMNYQTNLEGKYGCQDLCKVAEDVLRKNGFSECVAQSMTHPFHWIMNKLKVVELYQATNAGSKIDMMWALSPDCRLTAEELTDKFMDGFIDPNMNRPGDKRKDGKPFIDHYAPLVYSIITGKNIETD